MEHLQLYTKLNNLPADLKAEVGDFIDFLLSKKKKKIKKKKPVFGSSKGKIQISDDFDKPLQDFQEYM